MNPIEIFRAGTHTDSHGTTLNFSESDVAAMAAAYDPALSEAPIVVGHPKADAPAWGWIKSLTAQAGRLYALPDQVDPAFAEMVRAGRYKKLSAALYGPTSPANPRPGAWYLRHVGFLGAQPPAVKGLAPVCFASGDDGYITVEFSEELSFIARLVGLLRGLRDYITEKDGAEKAEAALPSWTLDDLQEGAAVARALPREDPSSFSEPVNTQQENPMHAQNSLQEEKEADLIRREQELARKEAAFHERERTADAAAFVADMLAEGRLTPAQSAGLAEFMAKLDAEGVVEFAEGSGTKQLSPSDFMKDFLKKLPKQVDFGEHSAPVDTPDELDPQEAASRVVAFQERHRAAGIVVTTTDALAAVKAGKDKE